MTLEADNPYRPPACAARNPPQSKASLLRGFAYAVPAAVVGFALPFVPLVIAILLDYLFRIPQIDFDLVANVREMSRKLLAPGIGCAVLFGLAAILNFVPAMEIGIVRALMFVGFSTLAGFFVMAIASVVFRLEPQTYTSDPWVWLRAVIAYSIPCVYTVVHTARLCKRSHSDTDAEIFEQVSSPASESESDSSGKSVPPVL